MGKCSAPPSLVGVVASRAAAERPAPPLLFSHLFVASDSEQVAGCAEGCDQLELSQVPVHRTFIQYGCSAGASMAEKPAGLRTAPAATAPSIRDSLAGEVICTPVRSPKRGDETSDATLPGSAASSARVSLSDISTSSSSPLQAVTYRLSPRSAKAAGYWRATSSEKERRPDRVVSSASTDLALDRLASSASSDDGAGESSGDEEDDEEEEEDLGLCPIYSANAPLPSLGSAGHGDGTCRRCCFFPKGRCNNGFECQFCHFAHEKRKPKNKKKKHKKRRNKQHKLASAGARSPPADMFGAHRPRTPGAVRQQEQPLPSGPVHIVLQAAIPLPAEQAEVGQLHAAHADAEMGQLQILHVPFYCY